MILVQHELKSAPPQKNMKPIFKPKQETDSIRKLLKLEFFSNEYEDKSVLENCQKLNSSPMNMRHSKY